MKKLAVVSLLVWCASVLLAGPIEVDQPRRDPDPFLTRLKSAGIPTDDPEKLIETIGNNPGLSAPAAFALGKLPKTGRAVSALEAAITANAGQLDSSLPPLFELAAGYAAEALRHWGEKKWESLALQRLEFMTDGSAQIFMAGQLAAAGHYEGFHIVKEGLFRPELVRHALSEFPYFVGMKGSDGKPLDLAQFAAMIPANFPEDVQSLSKHTAEKIRSMEK